MRRFHAAWAPIRGEKKTRSSEKFNQAKRDQYADYPLTIELMLTTVVATSTMALANWMPFAVVIFLLVPTNFALGLIAPNAIAGGHAAVPQIPGDAGAMTGSIQMMMGAVASWLVGRFYGEHSVLSMNAPVAARSLAALVSYLLLARRAERVVVPC